MTSRGRRDAPGGRARRRRPAIGRPRAVRALPAVRASLRGAGPVAQIAMLRRELVEEERWIDGGRFNRLLAVYQVLPGPEAHELAVHLGMLAGRPARRAAGGPRVHAAGLPAHARLSWLYFQVDLGQPAIGAAFLGIQVAVIALVVRAVRPDRAPHPGRPGAWLVALVAGVATLGGGAVLGRRCRSRRAYAHGAAAREPGRRARSSPGRRRRGRRGRVVALVVVWAPRDAGAPCRAAGHRTRGQTATRAVELFLSGLKAGLLTFGGAYTAIPFVRGDAVGNGWVTDAQFLDGLALSGILPAPLIIFSTFVGYVAGGLAGAVAMTARACSCPRSRSRSSSAIGSRRSSSNPALHRLLEGVAAGVVGIIAVTAVELAVVAGGRLPSFAGAAVILTVGLAILYLWSSRAAIPAAIVAGAALGLVLLGVAGRLIGGPAGAGELTRPARWAGLMCCEVVGRLLVAVLVEGDGLRRVRRAVAVGARRKRRVRGLREIGAGGVGRRRGRQDLVGDRDVDRLVVRGLVELADAAVDGQMRPLISFICRAWWLAPSCEPSSRTRSTHSGALSRQ